MEALYQPKTLTVREWYRWMFNLGWENDTTQGHRMEKTTPFGIIMAMPAREMTPEAQVLFNRKYEDITLNFEETLKQITTHTSFYTCNYHDFGHRQNVGFFQRIPNWALPTPEQYRNHNPKSRG